MSNLSTINLTDKLKKELTDYCKLNQIEDTEKFILKCLKKGFDSEKFGLLNSEEPQVTEVEVIKEVPVEKVVTKYKKDDKKIKELTEKIKELESREIVIPVSDDKNKMLSETLQTLRKELTEKNSKITELTNKLSELESLISTESNIKIKK